MGRRSHIQRYTDSATESDTLKALKDFALARGGVLFHIRDSRGLDVVGLPDTIIVLPPYYSPDTGQELHPGTLSMFELKTRRDRLSAPQRHILELLEQVTTVASGVIRPTPKQEYEISLDEALRWLGKEE